MKCINQFRMKNPAFPDTSNIEYINCSCGKCANCLVNRRQQWWFRLFNESICSNKTYFVTLTYDSDNNDGVLHPAHLTNFFKRLRIFASFRFRYYAIGEYGTHTLRPHYHVMFFVYDDDFEFVSSVEHCWYYGFVHVGACTPSSINYILHYHVRPKEPVEGLNTFQRFSKRLGLSFLFDNDDNGNLYIKNRSVLDMVLSSSNRVVSDGVGHTFVLPRYYVKKLKEQDLPIPEPDFVDSIPYQIIVKQMLPDARFYSDGTCSNYSDSYLMSLLSGLLAKSERRLRKYNYQTKTSI